MDYEILVNKENMLDRNYIPENLVQYNECNGEKLDANYKTMLEKETMKAFFIMKRDASLDGYNLIVDSGYRSYDYQLKILENRLKEVGDIAYNYVALPGASEHQTGLAFDVAFFRNGKYIDDFDDTFPEIIWLHENSYKYGFILRYPKGKETITGFNYECWHFRYVGKELALEMHERNIETLEEYYLTLHNMKRFK